MSLKTQFLILVIWTVITEVTVLYLSVSLQTELEQNLDRAQKSKAITEAVNKLEANMYNFVMTFHDTAMTAEFVQSLDLDAARSDAMKQYRILETALADNPEKVAVVKSSREAGIKVLEIFQNLRDNPGEQEALKKTDARRRIRKEIKRVAKGVISDELIEINREEKIIGRRSPEEEASIRKNQKNVMFASVFANILLAICGLVIVGRVSGRSRVILDNTARLAIGKPLNPPLKGRDEIAQLDGKFHEMSKTLEEADRMKQEVMAMITHDLRTPLSTIRGFLEMLDANLYGELSDKGKHMLKLADKNTDRMMGMINDLLDIEKIKAGTMQLELEYVPILPILEQSAESLTGLAAEAGVSFEVAPTDVQVNVDEQKIARVITNLLYNAVKFSPKDSTVKVSVETRDRVAAISVADQGRGIPAHMIAKIFDRFTQVESSDSRVKGGSGLGLAICEALVVLHGGSISVSSVEGKGATFTFTLPLSPI